MTSPALLTKEQVEAILASISARYDPLVATYLHKHIAALEQRVAEMESAMNYIRTVCDNHLDSALTKEPR